MVMRARYLLGSSQRLVAGIVLLACLSTSASEAVTEGSKWEWEGVSRIIALGDVHGSYDKMVALLKGTKLVNDELAWTGGNQHLVFCGDLTDRGSNDRAVMDLARRLQTEAEAAGGRVHVVLGNHDVMNLTRDRRYWNPDLTEEFAGDETAAERKEAFKQFRASARSQTAHDKSAFEEKFPPGYFARARAFELDGEYGAWLIEQPTVVKVNGVLFLHGGLTQRVAALGLDEINRQVTEGIRDFLVAADQLGDTVPFPADLGLIMGVAHQARGKGGNIGRAAAAVLEAHESLAFAPAGPVWYRGSSTESERLERKRVDEVLASLDARAEMVGHTVTRSGKISSRFEDQVYRADVGMGYGRPPLAAVIQGEDLLVFDPTTGTLSEAYKEPLGGEGWPSGEEDLADHQLERFLEKATIQESTPFVVEEGKEQVEIQILELEQKDMKLRAIFGDADESAAEAAALGRKARRRYQNQVAAYRLDRMFGLNMVPVTVFRKVGGKKGVVQIWIQDALDANEIVDYQIQGRLSDMGPEIARARAFSGLIGMEKRLNFGRLILPVPRKVMLSDNGVTFMEDPDIQHFLDEGCGPVGPSFKQALATLEMGKMKKQLGDLLSDSQIEAVLKRRDGILELCLNEDPDWSVEKLMKLLEPEG